MSGTTPAVGQQFHTQVKDYEKGRDPYSQKLFELVIKKIRQQFPDIPLEMLQVLDVGCGTGISTRALHASGLTSVFGMDIDPIMLESAVRSAKEAEGISVSEQHYRLGEVSKIQTVFSDKKFSVITSFSSFHWFCTPDEVNAMKTVMKAGSIFVAAFPGDRYQEGLTEYFAMIESIKGEPVRNPKENFHPIEVLESRGFTVEKFQFERETSYTFEKAVAISRSLSFWCNLTEEQKTAGEEKLREFIRRKNEKQNSEDGLYHQKTDEVCLIAYLKG